MSSRVFETLKTTDLSGKYGGLFKYERITDDQVIACIENPEDKTISNLIPSPEDYRLFITSFTDPLKYRNQNQNQNDDSSNLNSLNSIQTHTTLSTSPRNKSPNSQQSSSSTFSYSSLTAKSTQAKKNFKNFSTQVFTNLSRRHTFAERGNSKSQKESSSDFTSLEQFSIIGDPPIRNITIDVTENELDLEPEPQSLVEPVQIIDIPLKTLNEGDSLIFRQQNLEQILEKVGRRPVALLSIAGPSRQGKSFILGYMLRYLQSLSISQGFTTDNDWMGRSESKRGIPLEKGFAWRPGVERETTGMWMWPQPFALKREDGLEFDVLLMDTQGVFDTYTDKKDWATIVGLSLLTSSCLIFNIMNNLQEDSLITLKDFMDFGLMAKSQDDSEEKPFQKLLFLIRDWNSPDDYDFGRAGGSAFLTMSLGRKNTESGAHLRSQIRQCFQDLDCYLMPEPGSKVKRKTYNGSVAEMDPEFAENIERFIEHLFNPSTFPPKVIAGNLVTGEDLLLVFEQYVKIFNSDQMPSPTDMNQANALICNQTILNKCIVIYEESLEKHKSQHSKLFMLDEDLQKCHESSLEETLNHFQSSRKMGSKDELSKLKASLTTRCEASYKLACAENSRVQMQTVQMAIPKLDTFFRNIIADKMTEAFTGQDDFVADDVFQSLYSECEILSSDYLKDLLQLESLDHLPLASSNFHSTLEFLKESVELQNKMRRGEAENRMKEEVTKLSSEYKSLIEIKLLAFKYWTQAQIQKEETSVRTTVYQKFSSLFKDSSLAPHGRKLLTQGIQKEFEEIHKFVELQNQNYLMSVNFLVSELVTGYTLKMEESAQTTGLLGETHSQERNKCLESLSNFDNFDRLLPQDTERILQDLITKIDRTCQLLVDKWFPRIRQNFIRYYKDQINSFYGNGSVIFEQEKLQEKHEILKGQVLQEFKNFSGSIPVPVFTDEQVANQVSLSPAKIVQDFESELDNYMESIYEKNALRAEAVHETVKGFLSKAKNKYLELALELNAECKYSEDFDKTSYEIKDFILQYFEEQCQANCEEGLPLEPSFRHLQEFMNSVPECKRMGENTLLISGKVLKCSRELVTLDNILATIGNSQPRNQSQNPIQIKDVWWIAKEEIYLDENLCGEFWSGMNLVIKCRKIVVVGNERLVIVSGENGRSASFSQPPTPTEPGVNGVHGTSGFPGEVGGNISIQAEEIEGAENLRLISNGGQGGNGQPGGNGSKGEDGVGGNRRYETSLEFLEKHFPSPAKFIEATVQLNLRKGLQSMKKIAEDNESDTIEHKCCNSWSTCLSVETREGAVFHYGFFQGGLKGLVNGRSFYVWFEGAPGVLGQRGGIGGKGGKGGDGGNPGKIITSFGKGNNNVSRGGGEQVSILRKRGANGADGRDGTAGKNGSDGAQGTDYAIVDPYAGFYVPSNFVSKKKFMGRLEIVVGVKSKKNEAAYCPHRKKYVSFVQTQNLRPGVKIFEDPVDFGTAPRTSFNSSSSIVSTGAPDDDGYPVVENLRTSKEYKQEIIESPTSPLIPKPRTSIRSAIVGNAGGFYVREAELRTCIENEFLAASVVDAYATILAQLYPQEQAIAYLPSTAINLTSSTWKYTPQYIKSLAANIKSSCSLNQLTVLTAIVRTDKHWILFVADNGNGNILIANIFGSSFTSNFKEPIQKVISVMVPILDELFGIRNWESSYSAVAQQVEAHSSGPAALYFLEQLYQQFGIGCDDPDQYQIYRGVIVERILQTTEQGRALLGSKNDFSEFLEL